MNEWMDSKKHLYLVMELFFTEKATKYCGADGKWFQHPDSNRTLTNYTLCATTHEKRQRVTCAECNKLFDVCLFDRSLHMVLSLSVQYCSKLKFSFFPHRN